MTDPPPTAEHWLEHRVEAAEDGWQVREVLLRVHRLSRAMIRRLAQSRGLRLNGEVPFLSSPVREGDLLRFRLSAPEPGGLRPVPMQLDVVWEDRDLLVVVKPAGLLVHPTRRSHVRTLAHGVLAHLQQRDEAARPHPVHRLDRDTSGLVLFAKHSVAHQRLDRQLRARSLRRSYLAVVQGAFAAERGEVEAPIARHPDDAHLRSSAAGEGAPARTSFRVLERFAAATLVEVELETGRTHQIRVHMAHLGFPLMGDTAYGGRAHSALRRQALHAWRLRFDHPFSGEPVLCEAAPPPDMARLLSELRAWEKRRMGRSGEETRY
jgi:23S rRNA pseudouridine1911/1915/1917 synthase